MQVSVVIPTFNGAAKIVNVLTLLEQQTFKDFETIVVVDGSADDTEKILAGIKTSYALRTIVQKNKGRAGARNTRAQHALGETLVFLDDDMLPDPSCLELHLTHHAKHPGSISVRTAQTVYPYPKSDFHRFKEHIEKRWTETLPKETPIAREKIFLSAANFSVSKKNFDLIGSFDERLKDLEDFEFATRTYNFNVPVYYNSLAIAI